MYLCNYLKKTFYLCNYLMKTFMYLCNYVMFNKKCTHLKLMFEFNSSCLLYTFRHQVVIIRKTILYTQVFVVCFSFVYISSLACGRLCSIHFFLYPSSSCESFSSFSYSLSIHSCDALNSVVPKHRLIET